MKLRLRSSDMKLRLRSSDMKLRLRSSDGEIAIYERLAGRSSRISWMRDVNLMNEDVMSVIDMNASGIVAGMCASGR
jgi:hypothetical protein